MRKKPYEKLRWACAIGAVAALVLAVILRGTVAAQVLFGLALAVLLANFILERLQERHRKKMSDVTDSAPVAGAETEKERQEKVRVHMGAWIWAHREPRKKGR